MKQQELKVIQYKFDSSKKENWVPFTIKIPNDFDDKCLRSVSLDILNCAIGSLLILNFISLEEFHNLISRGSVSAAPIYYQ